MVEVRFAVTNEVGLHIKPAGQLSSIALQYPCNVWLRVREYDVNAKSLLGILSAQVKKGEEVVVRCDGPQEEECSKAILEASKDGFGVE